MMRIKKILFENQVRMRILNQSFVYAIRLTQGFLNLMPPFIRNFGFRIMLGRCGSRVFFDYDIYVKFPWLVEIGDDVSINRGVQFFPAYHSNNRITLGSDIYLAPNVCFFASGHDIDDLSKLVGGNIVVGDRVWIGANAIILPRVTIGAGCVIGAGSVVTKDIPPNSVAVGNPARVVKQRLESLL